MDDSAHEPQAAGPIIAVAINTTNTHVGLVEGQKVTRATSLPSTDADAIAAAARDMLEANPAIALVASINKDRSPAVVDALRRETGLSIQQFGDKLPVPIAHTLPEPVTTGLDRFLCALGAYASVQQACVVIDAGTAITCDFVDGTGVFHGGAILPGGQLMLDSLHERVKHLPRLNLDDMPSPLEPFGKSTDHAMLLGVQAAARGAVRYLAERYAGFYEAYPQIIATGGNAEILFADDELVETIVPHLQLIGIGAARARLIGSADDDQSD